MEQTNTELQKELQVKIAARKKNNRQALIIFTIIIAVLVVVLKITNKSEPEVYVPKVPTDGAIVVAAENFVEARLKTPSTAEFCSMKDVSINKIDSSEFKVSGFVDAQNIFGAMFRYDYLVHLTYDSNTEVFTLKDIYLE